MGALKFNARMSRFGKMGEKSSWTYIEITKVQANKLKPDSKKSFRVKGSFDGYKFEKVAMLPMGDGKFIIPIKGPVRKILGKEAGAVIKVSLEFDERKPTLSPDLMKCLKDDPEALKVFKALPGSHQNYYSNWVESAKTVQTKTKRILMTLEACTKRQSFSEMMRESQGKI
jgi:hypothetical protein